MVMILFSLISLSGICLLLCDSQCSAFSASTSYAKLQSSNTLLSPITGEPITSFLQPGKKTLVVVLPQLGEFDSSEYVEFLNAATPALNESNIDLKVIGIGNVEAATCNCLLSIHQPTTR